jgi:hypothetical protein
MSPLQMRRVGKSEALVAKRTGGLTSATVKKHGGLRHRSSLLLKCWTEAQPYL